jgi:protein-tyrosine phosphatase
LTSFDQPFNQAPSLHIALLIILWRLYARHLPPAAQWPLHIWFTLVGVSVLTTYQHHFFDIPTGALLGAFCLWLWRDSGVSAFAGGTPAADRRRRVLAARYLFASALLAALAWWSGGAGWWLFWPALSLLLVAVNYAFLGPEGFQKDAGGRMSLGAQLLLAPYLIGAFLNSRSWTWREPKPIAVAANVWLGRIPRASEAAGFGAVIDLSAELPGASRARRWIAMPMLDLVPPSPAQLRDAAALIERERAAGTVLVCCALGYSRSAAAVAAWLITSGQAATVSDALARVGDARPRIVISAALRERIAMAAERAA